MKITIWGINYAPEPTGIGPYSTDLCEYFHGRGHVVRMVTGFSYYPNWRKNAEDRGRLFRRENRSGVEIYRCWQYVPSKPNAWRRMLHEASFIWCSFWRLLFTPRPDLLIVISPPLLLGPAAWMASLIKRCPFHFHVQDMQPDAALSLGLLKPGPLTRCLYAVERFTCKRARLVSGITRGMVDLLGRKGVPAARRYLLPNWTIPRRVDDESPKTADGSFRRAHQVPPDGFLVLYSGNLGKKQGLNIILDAAADLARCERPAPIVFVIAGEGADKENLRRRIEAENLPVRLLPLQPEAMFQAMLREADLCLVTQQKGAGSIFFPSKLLTLLSAGRPVVTVADEESELARSVAAGRFGRNVLPEDPAGLAKAISALADRADERTAMGAAGIEWVRQFSRQTVLGEFADHLDTYFEPPSERLPSLAHEPK